MLVEIKREGAERDGETSGPGGLQIENRVKGNNRREENDMHVVEEKERGYNVKTTERNCVRTLLEWKFN